MVSSSKFHHRPLNLEPETDSGREAPRQSHNRRGENNRVGSGTQGWLGTDLRIVAYVRSCTSKVVLIDGGKKSAAINEKLPRRFGKALTPLNNLFLAISVKHLRT